MQTLLECSIPMHRKLLAVNMQTNVFQLLDNAYSCFGLLKALDILDEGECEIFAQEMSEKVVRLAAQQV